MRMVNSSVKDILSVQKVNQIIFLFLVLYLLIAAILPVYVINNPARYVAILDYSFLSSGFAGGDIDLLVNNTFDSPFTPLLKNLIEFTKIIINDNKVVVLWLYRIVAVLDIAIMLLLIKRYCFDSLLYLVLLTTVISYPFIHEIERGQWNFITIGLVVLALRFYYKNQFLSIILFLLAIQLKVFPVFFLPILFNKKGAIKYITLVLIFSFSLLMLFGYDDFITFVNNQVSITYLFNDGWELNPSLYSFVSLIEKTFVVDIPNQIAGIILWALYGYLIFKRDNFDDYSFFVLVALWIILWIPKSYDYRVSILIIPALMYLNYFITNNIYDGLLYKSRLFIIFNFIIFLTYIKVNFLAHGIAKYLSNILLLSTDQVLFLGQLIGSRTPLLIILFYLVFRNKIKRVDNYAIK